MRKLPILLFTAVFALSLALPAYAAESSNEELKAASQYLNSHGIMVGDGEGNMNFSAPLTRAHLATILARLHGGSGQVEESRDFYAAQCQFQDVPDWARQYAGYCAYHGLMVGYGGIFHRPCLRDRRPRGPLLRQAAPPAGRLRRVGGGG